MTGTRARSAEVTDHTARLPAAAAGIGGISGIGGIGGMVNDTPTGGSWSEFAEARSARVPPPPGDPTATAAMPPVPAAMPPVPAAGPSWTAPPVPPRRALIGRFTVTLGGLLAAGCLVLGVLLVILMVVVPRTGGTGIDVSTGPGWTRAGWHLGVGIAGAAAQQWARRRSWPLRLLVAVVVIAAVLAVLALSWWQ